MARIMTPSPDRISSRPQRPKLHIRRWGWNDFERFDEETARGSHICVGSKDIGKVEVDCKYNWRRSQWGILGQQRTPAGTVYMDITFKQLQKYWLRNATVSITLSTADPATHTGSRRKRRNSRGAEYFRSAYSVQMTGDLGPKCLLGPEKIVAKTRNVHGAPTVEVAGFGFGGLGFSSRSSELRASQWCFKGTVMRAKEEDGLRKLEWELTENDLEHSETHCPTYHTAFAFEHSEEPVFMNVEIAGQLQSKSRQSKHQLMRFFSGSDGSDGATITRIDLSRDDNFWQRLDDVVAGLDETMRQENLASVPVRLPGSQPASISAPSTTRMSDSELTAVEYEVEEVGAEPKTPSGVGSQGPNAADEDESECNDPLIEYFLDEYHSDDFATQKSGFARTGDGVVTANIQHASQTTQHTLITISRSAEMEDEIETEKLLRMLLRVSAIVNVLKVLSYLLNFLPLSQPEQNTEDERRPTPLLEDCQSHDGQILPDATGSTEPREGLAVDRHSGSVFLRR